MEPILLLKSSKVILNRVPDVFAPGPNLCKNLENDLFVNTDIDAIMKFLSMKKSVKNTIIGYYKEIETFLLWLEQSNISFTSFTANDCIAYADFLESPNPLNIWVGTIQKKILQNNKINSDWRPFSKVKRSKISVRISLRKIHSLYSFLRSNCYVYKNPVPANLMNEDSLSVLENRYSYKTLSPQLTRFILKLLERRTNYNYYSKECFVTNRTFMIFYIFLNFGLKISELVELRASDLIALNNAVFINIRGPKGRLIEIESTRANVINCHLEYMKEFFELKAAFETPIISNAYGAKKVTTKQISTIVKSTLMDVSKVIIQNQSLYENTMYKRHFHDDLKKCQMATAQWLRNSFGSAKVESMSMRPIEAMKSLGNIVPLSVILFHVNSVKTAKNFTDKHRREIEKIYDQMKANESEN